MRRSTNAPCIGKGSIDNLILTLSNALYQQYGSCLQPFDMLVVGGAALAIKHNSRMTTDINVDIKFNGKITEAVTLVAKYNNLPVRWLNTGFVNTSSYSSRLWDKAMFYKQLGCIRVYIVSDLDQLCMKAEAGRDKDLSDIEFLVGNLVKFGVSSLAYEMNFAYLYGGTSRIKDSVKKKVINEFKKYSMYVG